MSNRSLVNKAYNAWEPEARNIDDLPSSQKVGVLLTGGLINWSTYRTDHLGVGEHGDRFLQTYLLYESGKINKIVITGANANWIKEQGRGEGRQVKELLVKWGVEPSDILLEEKARNTRENALYTKALLDNFFPNQSYVLITSAFHMPRAMACFKKVGLQVDPFPADYYGGDFSFGLRNTLLPEASVMGPFTTLWREWIGYIVYHLVGYC
ncbi:YdcF family protein [Dyadobacter jejuensis]|nr:YdcF family protein [Dyadobacter jejuensis]